MKLSKLKCTDKPVVKVKYGKNGTNSDIRYKYTLLTTLTGLEAKAIRKSKNADHGLYWLDDGRKIEIYDEHVYTVRKAKGT